MNSVFYFNFIQDVDLMFFVHKLTDFSSNIRSSDSAPTIKSHPDATWVILGKLGHYSTAGEIRTLKMAEVIMEIHDMSRSTPIWTTHRIDLNNSVPHGMIIAHTMSFMNTFKDYEHSS